ncbi:MAG: ABC transporter permease [Candidatus Aminicenantes bacterium]|nr:ABC transporter permease [Candidatus Aminicenantes bacterium]
MRKKRPPRVAERMLSLLSKSSSQSDLLGDSEEEFSFRLAKKGRFRAVIWYVSQIFFPLPFLLISSFKWRVIMFQNYAKITLRNIKKHKAFSFINITGLAVGMACCILIVLFFQDEKSFDNYHQDLDRLYRVTMHYKGNWEVDFAYVGPPVGPILRRDFFQVEKAARLQRIYFPVVSYGRKIFYETKCFWAENEIFDILTFPFLVGDPASALMKPKTLALSENMAKKYFGSENPVGKMLRIDEEDFEVTAVYENCPENTHLKCDLLASFKTIENMDMASAWGWTTFYTYLKLAPNVDVEAFGKQILNLQDLYQDDTKGQDNTYYLQKVRGIHLHSHLAGEAEPPGNPTAIFITATIGFLILLMACINFMNLSTARFSSRAQEVGMRKVVGASRRQLTGQFLGESLLISFLSFFAALAIAGASLPVFNEIAGKTLSMASFFQPGILVFLILILLFAGFTSGSYPAFILSAFRPVASLKGDAKIGKKGSGIRKTLVVVQFAVSAFLLIGTMIISRQMNFMKNTSLGFSKEQKLVLPVKSSYLKDMNFEPLKTDFLRFPQVYGAAVSSHVPGRGAAGWATTLVGHEEETGQPMAYWFVDYDFLSLYELEIIAGRYFEQGIAGDKDNAFIINESTVRAFGLKSPEDALERQIEVGNGREGRVIGVVKDFHYEGLQQNIGPLLMAFGPEKGVNRFNPTGLLTLTVISDNMEETLSLLKQKWLEFHPDIPYSFYFVDDIFDMKYRAEANTYKIFSIFSFLGLFISCLGLFGLASFVAEQQTKEIGIRKVLGASISGIVFQLSQKFLKWVLFANLIIFPVAYIVMRSWLQNFAYRISISPLVFAVSTFLSIGIALLTVSFQTIRTATANPVDSLRYE